jgi:Mg2+ and Co2+ transporter CorA
LFETRGIPSKFVDESLRGVSQSFAVREDVDGTTWIWFHLLCKTLTVLENQVVPEKGPGQVDDEKAQSRNATQAQSYADFTWVKPGIVLKIRKKSDTHTKPTRMGTSDSDVTLATTPVKSKVELICFGAPSSLHDRIRAVIRTTSCEELLEDPYMFLDIVFEEMYKILDCTAWAVADKFGPMEYVCSGFLRLGIMLTNSQQTLQIAIEPGKSVDELPKEHFTGLHNLAKHTIYLRENCEAALATLDDLYSHHKTTTGEHPEPLHKHTRQGLKYRKTLFESTQRRLASLDSRISNIIELSFNIVTQGDSKLMQSENQSMKTIAVMTLLFMPLGTVASIFGTQFMKLQDERPYHITVSQDFWLMWGMCTRLACVRNVH